jgi:hypothetical protein
MNSLTLDCVHPPLPQHYPCSRSFASWLVPGCPTDRGQGSICSAPLVFSLQALFPEQVAWFRDLGSRTPTWSFRSVKEAPGQAGGLNSSRSISQEAVSNLGTNTLEVCYCPRILRLAQPANTPWLLVGGEVVGHEYLIRTKQEHIIWINYLIAALAPPQMGVDAVLTRLAPDACVLSSLIVSFQLPLSGDIRRLLSLHQTASVI